MAKFIYFILYIFIIKANAIENVLVINSSASGDISVTRKLSKELLDGIIKKYPEAKIINRDLNANPVPNVTSDLIIAFYTPLEKQDDKIKEILQLSNTLTQEVLDADLIIIGAPMYNFGIPSSLKAWIDSIVRPGVTFRYVKNSVEGLISSKAKLIIVASNGGDYSLKQAKHLDYVIPYLKTIFGFIGVKNIEVVRNQSSHKGDIKDFYPENIEFGELSTTNMEYFHQVSDKKATNSKIFDIIKNI